MRGEGTVEGGTNEEAAACNLVVVATPWDSAIATTSALRQLLKGKIVISMVNALSREGREMVALYPSRGSMAAQIAHRAARERDRGRLPPPAGRADGGPRLATWTPTC